MKVSKFNLEEIHSADFWDQAWQRYRQESLFASNDEDPVALWNKRAANFTKNTTGKRGEKRVEETLSWFKEQGVELTGSRVLDIGAGPGSFSIPLAKNAKEVVALEPSGEMVKHMQELLKEEKVENVRSMMEKWEDIDIKQEGFKDNFDLVFSSMNPGICDRETLEKALQCSKKYCFISAFAGKRDNAALQELWQIIYKEKMPPWPGEIFFISNILYSLGYQFSYKVWEKTSTAKWSTEEAEDYLLDMLELYGSKKRVELASTVKKYVMEKSINDTYLQETTTRLGKILVTK